MGFDVILSMQDFFRTGLLMPNLNSNILVLIPKVFGRDFLSDFRLIALPNLRFKIITKILAKRLTQITTRIISINQRGFVRDLHISDCVIIATEDINLLGKKTFGGNLALKVDKKKAFDKLDWHFLRHVLAQFDFNQIFLN